jgi:hypothetical protein
MSQFRSPGPYQEPPPNKQQEELPGDFSFKVVGSFDASASNNTDNELPLTTALFSLGVVGFVFMVLFFGTVSLNMKFHLFTFFLSVGLIFYNYQTYGKPELGESILDTYEAYSTDDEGNLEELGRFGKWFRLLFSLMEPLDPDGLYIGDSAPSRGEASVRTLLEWLIIGVGVLMGSWWFIKYYFQSNGPYFHDIWGIYISTLFFALALWVGYWLYYRAQDGWLEIKQHTEALNYLLCRWVIGYGLLWIVIVFLFIVDEA